MCHNKRQILLISLSVVVLAILFLHLTKKQLKASTGISEVSIECLYKTGVIDSSKLISDDTYYLRMNTDLPDNVFLKRGKDNNPFSINSKTLTVKAISQGEWEKAQIKLTGKFYEAGGFISEKGGLQNMYSQAFVKPSGEYILQYSVSPDNKFVYIYSFSGYYRKSKGIGIWVSSAKKVGMNYFEIWEIEKGKREFSYSTISFSKDYWPDLLFWLEDKKLMIFSNKYNKSIMIIKY